MFAVVVTFKINPGQAPEFLPLMHRNARASLENEPGCRKFDVCTDPDRPDEVFLYEIYNDAAAFDVHRRSTHFLAFSEETSSMIAAKSVRTYREVAS